MESTNCTKCTLLASSLSEYKQKCSKLLSIILNELDDVKKTVPLSNIYLEQFLEKIRLDLTDVMVGLVNRKLEKQIENLDIENETLRNNVSELERKIQDLENKNDVFADLVDTERTAEAENKNLKRKLSQMQNELEQISKKRQKRSHEKRVKIADNSKNPDTVQSKTKSKTAENLKNSKSSKNHEKMKNPENSEPNISGQKLGSDKKCKLIPLPFSCSVLTIPPNKKTFSRGTCTADDKQPYKVLNYKPVPTTSSSSTTPTYGSYGFGKTPNSLKEKTNIIEPKKRQRLEHLCNL